MRLPLRRRRGDRHGWNSWDHYLAIYERCIRDLSPFVVENRLTYTVTPEVVHWSGKIICQSGIELDVNKVQQVKFRRNGQMQVRTEQYSYHAVRRRESHDAVNLLRYDNIHSHRDHRDSHHRHAFTSDGDPLSAEHVGYDGWPVMSEVLEELRDRFGPSATTASS